MENAGKLYGVEELREMFGVCGQTVYTWVRLKKLTPFFARESGHWPRYYFSKENLINFIEQTQEGKFKPSVINIKQALEYLGEPEKFHEVMQQRRKNPSAYMKQKKQNTLIIPEKPTHTKARSRENYIKALSKLRVTTNGKK